MNFRLRLFFAVVAISCSVIGWANPSPPPIRFLLSFDDGPSVSLYHNPTEQILNTLAKNSVQPDIKAIFFTQTRPNRSGGTEQGRKNNGSRMARRTFVGCFIPLRPDILIIVI